MVKRSVDNQDKIIQKNLLDCQFVEKLLAIWERKSKGISLAGQSSLMAISLSACGGVGNDKTPYSKADLLGFQELTLQHTDLTTNHEALTTSNASLQTNFGEITASKAALERSYESLNQTQQALQETYDALVTANTDLQVTHNGTVTAKAALQSDHDNLVTSVEDLTESKTTLQATYDSKVSDYNTLLTNYNVLLADYDGVTGAKSEALTSGIDRIIGGLNSDEFSGTFGSNATLTSSDVIIDTNSGDGDILNLTGTKFTTTLDTSIGSIMVEVVNVVFDTVAGAIINAGGMTSSPAINISNVNEGAAASLTVTDLKNGAIVSVKDFNRLNITGSVDADVTVVAPEAESQATASVSGSGDLTILAEKVLTVTTSAQIGNTTINAEKATSFTATSTLGDITVLSSENSYTRAISTLGGNITVDTPVADRVLATTAGQGSVVVIAEGDSGIKATGNSIAVRLQNGDPSSTASIEVTGTGIDDTLSIISENNFSIENKTANPIENISVSPMAAIEVTLAGSAADEISSTSQVKFAGDHSVFHNSAVFGSKVNITALNNDTDMSKVQEAIELSVMAVDNSGGDTKILLNSDAILTLSGDQANGLEINADDDFTNTATDYLKGTLNVHLKANQTGTIVIDPSSASTDGFDFIYLSTFIDQTSPLVVNTAATTEINISGTHNVNIGNSVAKSIDASGLVGDGLGLSGILTAVQTSNLLSVIGGTGKDQLSSADTSVTANIIGGGGDDTITLSGNFAGTARGGAHLLEDTLELISNVDISSATISEFEVIDLNANSPTVDEGLLNGSDITIESTGGAATLSVGNILSSISLSRLTFADTNVTINMDFSTKKDASLTATSPVNITGSNANDTITGHQGADILTGGEGLDTINGGAGSDSIVLTETTSVADIVVINSVVGTSQGSGRTTVTGNDNDTGGDTVTGFTIGTDIIKITATGVVGFAHVTDTAIGTATGSANNGTPGSFLTTVGLVELNQTTNNDWDDAGDVALTFATPSVALTETNFEASLQYDITGTAAANAITGGGLADTLTGGDGGDTLKGGAGSDTLTGGEGTDIIDGGAGSDSIILTETASVADTVEISAVVGTSEGSGRTTVAGNDNDTGDDTITGFTIGTDIIEITATGVVGFVHGTDTAIGTATGAVNDGTVGSFLATVGLVELNQTTNNAWSDAGDVAVTFATPSAALTETNFEASLKYDITGTTAANTITGGDFADTLTGGEGTDTLNGGAGSDSIVLTETTSVADTVVINSVVGTSEGSGRTTVTGNANDTGDDTITGFNLGTDIIKITATDVVGFEHVTDTAIGTATAVNDGTVGSFAATVGLIELNQTTNGDWDDAGDVAVTFASLTGTLNKVNFETVLQYDITGTAAANAITGGGLADTLTGGDGGDTLKGGNGVDTIVLTETVAAADTVIIALADTGDGDHISSFENGAGKDVIDFDGSRLSVGGGNITTDDGTDDINAAAVASAATHAALTVAGDAVYIFTADIDASSNFTTLTDTQIVTAIEAALEETTANVLSGTAGNAVTNGTVNTKNLLAFSDGANVALVHYAEGVGAEADFAGELSVIAVLETNDIATLTHDNFFA